MRVSTREILCHIRDNKIFLHFTLISGITTFAGGLISGFVGVYKINDLAMSIFTIQVINIFADFLRMGVSSPIARYSNKNGYASGIQLAGYMSVISYILMMLTTPSTRWLIIPFTLLTSSAQAGSYQNSFNISYSLLPSKYMTQSMAIKRTFTGVVHFCAALAGGKILDAVQSAGNTVFGFNIYAQQLLAAMALVIYAIGLVLNHKCVIKPLREAGNSICFDKM